MKIVVGVDLGSTTTKAVLLDEQGEIVGRGITNSRSNYEVACAVARDEALTNARFNVLSRALSEVEGEGSDLVKELGAPLQEAFRLELYLDELSALSTRVFELCHQAENISVEERKQTEGALEVVMGQMRNDAPSLFRGEESRKSDFFRDLAGSAYLSSAEKVADERDLRFESLVWPFDRAILDVETDLREVDFASSLKRASKRVLSGHDAGQASNLLEQVVDDVVSLELEEVAFVGTGYGRQTLPFPKEAVRSEILCHGRGAHRVFPETKTVLDIGGQDTKAIQVDNEGVVTSFQMNDRCAAGCGRYLGYIADELNLGLHELGPLALKSCKTSRINSTCTVFAGAELRARLALGEAREDILAGLHRAIMLRAMSLLARSGGVFDEFTFTGGVCKNPMATKVLRQLVDENYSRDITLNAHPDSIYMGALGGAMFGFDDVQAGKPCMLPTFGKMKSES
ncbi:MAG: benzoyl-CoA reductase subunit A [Deltaproteobacteria bacterium]|nr:benzoyl-CoA reductase subunit A [Deltaproteobacteria bacterium]